jgi:hypothetical protein
VHPTRRLDVAGPPESAPRQGAYATDINREENMAAIPAVFEIAKSVVK